MDFSEIKPFCRYVRTLKLTPKSVFLETLPLDCRIFYVKKGEGIITVGGTTLTLPTGSLLFINAFEAYRLQKCDVEYLAVNFDFSFRYSFLKNPVPPVPAEKKDSVKPIEKVVLSSAPCFKHYCFIENALSFSSILFDIEKEFTEKPPYYAQKNSAQLSEVLIEIYKKDAFPLKNENSFNAEEIAGYIREHLSEDINNEILAEHFHFHKNYLSSQFARCYGKPIHQYILEMRIIKAVSLLEAGRKSINEISEQVGFKDANYFARYFKKITGVSPTAYVGKSKKY